MIPHQGVLLIEEHGAGGVVRVVRVGIRNAEVVRVSRDPTRPWEWRERPERVAGLPVGTFVVVIGTHAAPNAVDVAADRIEVPR
jgi:hypothetical protein